MMHRSTVTEVSASATVGARSVSTNADPSAAFRSVSQRTALWPRPMRSAPVKAGSWYEASGSSDASITTAPLSPGTPSSSMSVCNSSRPPVGPSGESV